MNGQPAGLDVVDPLVRNIALTIATRVMRDGARAVVLTGSQVRPDPRPESDIDLYVIGEGPEYRLEIVAGRLVSVSWRTFAQFEAAFDDPRSVGAQVPGWRRAMIVADPAGVAAALQRKAREWDWTQIGDARLDAWVAEEITGYAEEAHKLVAARNAGDITTAAIQRSVLALALAPRLTVHFRMLYETENGLWDLMATHLGPAWNRAQRAALILDGEDIAVSLDASLDLFHLAVSAVWRVMDGRQRDVCAEALALAGRPAPR